MTQGPHADLGSGSEPDYCLRVGEAGEQIIVASSGGAEGPTGFAVRLAGRGKLGRERSCPSSGRIGRIARRIQGCLDGGPPVSEEYAEQLLGDLFSRLVCADGPIRV